MKYLLLAIFMIGFASAGIDGIIGLDLGSVPPTIQTGGNYSINVNFSDNSDKLDGFHASYFYPYSNPFGFYNSTTLPSVNLSSYINATNDTVGDSFLMKNGNTATLNITALDTRYLQGGFKSFYFTNHTSDVAGMYNTTHKLSDIHGLTTLTATANDGTTNISKFIAPSEPTYAVSAGTRTFHIDASVSNVAKITQLRGLIYRTNLTGGNLVLLRNSTLSIPLTIVQAEYTFTASGTDLIINSSERILFVIQSEKEAGGVLPTVTLYLEDDTLSRLDVPSPVGVTDISNLVPYTGATQDVDLGIHNLKLGGSQVINIPAPTNGLATQEAGLTFTDLGNSFTFKVYALVGGIYSPPLQIDFTDTGTGETTYDIGLSWTGVVGATLYRVVIFDNVNGYYGDAYWDEPSTSFVYYGQYDYLDFTTVEYVPSPLSPVTELIGGLLTSNSLQVNGVANIDGLLTVDYIEGINYKTTFSSALGNETTVFGNNMDYPIWMGNPQGFSFQNELNGDLIRGGLVLSQDPLNSILEFGVNMPQFGTNIYERLTTRSGGLFRFDLRPSQHLFSIYNIATGGSDARNFNIDLETGNIGMGGLPDSTYKVKIDGSLITIGNTVLQDGSKAFFGTAQDASIYYTGINLIINPKEVGSGIVNILGNLTANNLCYSNGTNCFADINQNETFWNITVSNKAEIKNLNITGNFTLTDTQWDDVSVPVSGLQRGVKTPVFDETTMAWYFEDQAVAVNEEYIFGQMEMPHGWKLGTDLHCHIHTHPSSTNVGNATFELSYVWTNIGAVEGSPIVKNLTVQYNGTAGLVQIPEWSVINGTGKTLSSVMEFRLKRLSSATSDTFTGNAYVDNFGCHLEKDAIGSNEELIK